MRLTPISHTSPNLTIQFVTHSYFHSVYDWWGSCVPNKDSRTQAVSSCGSTIFNTRRCCFGYSRPHTKPPQPWWLKTTTVLFANVSAIWPGLSWTLLLALTVVAYKASLTWEVVWELHLAETLGQLSSSHSAWGLSTWSLQYGSHGYDAVVQGSQEWKSRNCQAFLSLRSRIISPSFLPDLIG